MNTRPVNSLEPIAEGPGEFAVARRQPTSSRASRRVTGRLIFALIVLLPTLAAAIYYGLVASDRYLSESRFLVRSAATPQAGGLASFLRTVGISRADDDAYAVQSYILSRDALRDLSATLPMRQMLDREGADPLSRCLKPWSKDTFETLYRCYLDRVQVVRGDETGITRLRVDLFAPDDSYRVSAELIRLGEALANRMNERAEQDALAHATTLLEDAEAGVLKAQTDLTTFRNRELILDIEGSSERSNAVIAALMTALAETRATIDQQQRVSPASPQTAPLAVRAAALEEQIREERLRLTGDENALVNQMSEYETLVLRRNLADEAFGIASDAIDQARREARRQSIYVETVVSPNLPDQSTRPRRARTVLTVLITSLFIFGMVWLFVLGSREHLNRE